MIYFSGTSDVSHYIGNADDADVAEAADYANVGAVGVGAIGVGAVDVGAVDVGAGC